MLMANIAHASMRSGAPHLNWLNGCIVRLQHFDTAPKLSAAAAQHLLYAFFGFFVISAVKIDRAQ
jgi:hypothetical protein